MRGTGPRVGRSVRRSVSLLLALLLGFVARVSAERLPIKAYTIESGLAHNRVKRIVQDSHAFLWFCTAAGLSRFDGYQFTNYGPENGLPALSINDLVEAADGVYWIATNSDGVIRFDLRTALTGAQDLSRRFTVHTISKEPVTNRVNVLYRDRSGALWAGTDGGLFRMTERGGKPAFEPVTLAIRDHSDIQTQVWALVEDRAGTLWIGTRFGLLRRSRDGLMTRYAVNPSLDDDRVTALTLDSDGSIWMGHRTGLFHFSPGPEVNSLQSTIARALPGDTRRYTAADGLDSDAVMAVLRSADGRIWVRTFGRSLTEFDGRRFRNFAVGDGVGDIVGALTEDREGNLWLGTTARGALKVMRDGWTTYGDGDGLGESVASIFEGRSGEIYVNSSAWRISRFDGQRFTTVKPRLGSAVTDVSWRDVNVVIQDHTGDWWVATRDGLYRFARVARFEDLAKTPPVAVYTVRDGLANNDVTRLFEDAQGDIWISSWLPASEPLVRWERATGTFRRYSDADGLRPFTSIVSFREDAAANVWVGLREGGLFRYRHGRFTEVGRDVNLAHNSVNSLYLDPAGRLWAAAGNNGLCRIDHPDAEKPEVITYTMRDGLTSSVIHVTGDLDGRIYAYHMRGIDRLDPSTARIKHYSTADVLPGAEVKSAIRDRSGALWFATTTGLARLVPAEGSRTSPPPILIGALRIAGVVHALSALGEVQVPSLRLAPSQNNIQIDFFGLGFRAGETLRYQYKLEGASDWSAPRDQRSVDFASLAPGRYRFAVRAVTTDGTPSTAPATVDFEILPPFWRRWWFLAAAASVLAAGIIAFARYRYERLKALRDSENRFRSLAETASDAIVTIDQSGRIVLVNRAAEQVFGYTRQEILDANLTMLVPGTDKERREITAKTLSDTPARVTASPTIEVEGLRKDGARVPLEITFGRFTQNNQRFFTGIMRDVTERKRAEEALRRSREERLIELERVRKRIATDLHDDIGSSLTRISLLSEVVGRQVGSDSTLVEPLASVAGLSRELVDAMSDIVWAINPTKDHLSDLSQRMRHFVSDVCTARQIDFTFRTPPTDCDIPVGANVRREVFLLFKESVNNIVRHSDCSEADLEFSVTDRGLVLRVGDNGRGFDVGSASAGHGLRSMRERTAALGGHVQMVSAPGEGTVLTFTIPLTERSDLDAASRQAVPA